MQHLCNLAYVVLWMNLLVIRVSVKGTTCEEAECKTTMLGEEYAGMINITRSGRTCQRWEHQFPHIHFFGFLYTEENYCRNPDKTPGGPWCYTTDLLVRWEYCDVPFCDDTTMENCSSTVRNTTISTASSAVSNGNETDTVRTQPTRSRTAMSSTGPPAGQTPNIVTTVETQPTDKTQTSQSVRRRTSASDKRPSSKAIGSVAVILLLVVAVFISLSDCINIFQFLLEIYQKRNM